MANIGSDGDVVGVDPYTTGTNGTQINPIVSNSQTFVTVNGNSMLMQGDDVPEHVLWDTGPFGGSFITDTHVGSTLVTSQTFVTINGVPVAVGGDYPVQIDSEGDPVLVDGEAVPCDPSHTLVASTTFVDIS